MGQIGQVITIAALLLVGCTRPPDHIAFSEPVPTASVQEIFVTGGRLPTTTPVDLQADRNAKTRYVRYDISIPQGHALGQIEWPDGATDAATDFAVVGFTERDSSAEFIKDINAKPSDDVTVFVHGYNNTPSEALYRFAQVSHDFEMPAPRVLFAWPSAGRPAGYVYDRDSILFSRDPLARLLRDISRKTDKKITLMAHSMGAHLAMEAMRQLALTGQRDVLEDLSAVVLLAPDIDPDIFRAQANAIGKLPEPFVIMTNRDDRALNLSSFLSIGRQKVGDLSRASDVEGLGIILFDFTTLADGSNLDHLVPLTSPVAIAVLRDLVQSGNRGELDLSNFDVGSDGVIRTRPPSAYAELGLRAGIDLSVLGGFR